MSFKSERASSFQCFILYYKFYSFFFSPFSEPETRKNNPGRTSEKYWKLFHRIRKFGWLKLEITMNLINIKDDPIFKKLSDFLSSSNDCEICKKSFGLLNRKKNW